METYISLLRGINVSGSKMIKMDQLKLLYHDLHFNSIQTYIQSGNVIFRSGAEDIKLLEIRISEAIRNQFGFDVPVLIVRKKILTDIIDNNPFVQHDPGIAISELYVTILKDVPIQSVTENLLATDYSPEKIALREKTIYLFLPNGYGNTKLNNNFFESRLKTSATTRNWKTLMALASMAE